MNMTSTETAPVTVTCDCPICESNATYLGLAFPLTAYVNARMAAALKITAKNANSAKKVHRLVYAAYDPSLAGAAYPARFGPWASVAASGS